MIVSDDGDVVLNVGSEERKGLACEAKAYHTSVRNKYFLPIEFETLQDYLSLLETCGKRLGALKEQSSFFLAAAVSDFYIPDEKVIYTSTIM